MDIRNQSHLQGDWAGKDLRTVKGTLQKRLETLQRAEGGSSQKSKGKKNCKGLLLSWDRGT